MDILTLRQRLAAQPPLPAVSLDLLRAMACRIQVAVFDAGGIASLSGVSSLTMLVKQDQTATDVAALMAATVAAADFETATVSGWVAGTAQQATFNFTAAETNLDLQGGARQRFWVVFKALLNSGSTVVLGSGWLMLHEANAGAVGNPPENPGPALDAAAADARFLRFDGEQVLTEGQQLQARANMGLDGPLGVTDHGALTGLSDDDHPQYHNDARGDLRYAPLAHGHPQSDVIGLTSALAGKADLVGGLVPTSQIPAIAITTFLGSVASQAAMLALTGQTGDWCNRSDTSTAWVIVGSDPTQISSWAQINYPASPVTSVNGQTGAIVLGAANVGAPPTSRSISTVQSLMGGGDFSANRVISLVGDTAAPGGNKLYGTDEAGGRGWRARPWKPGMKVVTGYTSGGGGSTSASLYIETYSTGNGLEASIIIDTDAYSETFIFAPSDPMSGAVWIDSSSLYASEDYTAALASAISSSVLSGYVSVDYGSSNYLNVTRSAAGASYYINAVLGNVSLTMNYSGGGYGTDGDPPSGGVQSIAITTGGYGIVSGLWMSEDGFSGNVELYNDNDEVLWSLGSQSPGTGGMMFPGSYAQAALWAGTSGLYLRATEPVPVGGSLGVMLVLF